MKKPYLRDVPAINYAMDDEIIREFGIEGEREGGRIRIHWDEGRQRLVVELYGLHGDVEIRQTIGGKP